MKETAYTIRQIRNTFAAFKGNVLISQGCIEKSDALHSIWKNEGSNKDHVYIIRNDVVCCVPTHTPL